MNRRYRVVEALGSWWVVSADYEPARKGRLGRGTYICTAYETQQFAQADADARNRVEEMKDAMVVLRA